MILNKLKTKNQFTKRERCYRKKQKKIKIKTNKRKKNIFLEKNCQDTKSKL